MGDGRRKRHDVVRYAVYRTKGKGSLGRKPHHASCTWSKLPNQESPVSRGKQGQGCCYMLCYIMHPTLSSPSALHPSQQRTVSPPSFFSSDPPEVNVCAVKGSHDSEGKHGAEGEKHPKQERTQDG